MMFASDNLFIFFNKKQQHNYYQVKLSTKEYYVITRSSSLLKPQLFRTYKTNFIFHEKHILTFFSARCNAYATIPVRLFVCL